jgi:hypothetical protein
MDSGPYGLESSFFYSIGCSVHVLFRGLLYLGAGANVAHSQKGGEVLFSAGGIITPMQA